MKYILQILSWRMQNGIQMMYSLPTSIQDHLKMHMDMMDKMKLLNQNFMKHWIL